MLATSRAPLRLSGEHVLPLEPLSIDDASTLFVELAAARGVVLHADALASVHEICRRLDGLPLAIELVAARLVVLPPPATRRPALAIELVAARLVVLPPAEILRALADGLALEMEGPVDLPERQRTLRAAIDWSYQRLSERQRELHGSARGLRRRRRARRRACDQPAQAESSWPDLEALVAWSLVRSEITDGEVRLSMLETVREHALDRLALGGQPRRAETSPRRAVP